MAWFKCGGGGIPAALKNAMNTVLNKKFGTTGQNYPPAGWPDDVNLLGPLPVKTASGAVASFSDGADDVPLRSASFGILASGGGGTPSTPVPIVGKSSVTIYQAGKNFIDFASHVTTGTSVGMTFSATADGGISYSGTATGTFGYATAEFDFTIKSGQTFTFSRNTAFNYIHRIRLVFSDDTTANVSISANNTSVTYTPAKDVKAVRLLLAGLTVDTYYNDTVYVQTEYGSTPTTFQKYKSKTPITIQLGQTVYGGTLAEDGTLTVTHKYDVFDGSNDESWARNVSGDKTRVYIPLSDAKASNGNFIGNYIIALSSAQGYPDEYKAWINASSQLVIGVPSTITSASDWKTFLSNNNLQVAYELATPLVITGLDEISISTYLGGNTIWVDTGDTECEYYADIDLALQAVSGSRGLMMSSLRSAEPMISAESDPEEIQEETPEEVDQNESDE